MSRPAARAAGCPSPRRSSPSPPARGRASARRAAAASARCAPPRRARGCAPPRRPRRSRRPASRRRARGSGTRPAPARPLCVLRARPPRCELLANGLHSQRSRARAAEADRSLWAFHGWAGSTLYPSTQRGNWEPWLCPQRGRVRVLALVAGSAIGQTRLSRLRRLCEQRAGAGRACLPAASERGARNAFRGNPYLFAFRRVSRLRRPFFSWLAALACLTTTGPPLWPS